MLLLPKFDFYEPESVTEACQIMAEFSQTVKPIAGGTDLIVNMKKKLLSPKLVVSLSGIDELKAVDSSHGMLSIGACFTVANLAESQVVSEKWGALCSGAKALGSPLVRNLATIGGNIGSARPAADLLPSLIAYRAKVILKKKSGERTVSLDHFFKGPGMTLMDADEILTQILIPDPPPSSRAAYINLGIRKAQDCNLVNVASFIVMDDPDGRIKDARIVMGCVGPTPLRSPSAEKLLIGEKPSKSLFEKAGETAKGDCSPILDFRGSSEYRKDMAGVLTRRTLGIAYQEIKTGK